MWAIIQSGGRQHRVEVGLRLRIGVIEGDVGSEVTFDKVLCLAGEGQPAFGTPYLDSARVVARVLAHGRGRKIVVFRQKQRKGYRRKTGHRQPYTEVQVTGITGLPGGAS